ncbi:MAG: glutamine--tRNA ligase/YqeY domain fusion protein [Thermoflexibacter sp.]|nr:glutamine--tRNA ligase/YqeY domain fusion protein [Thermoflexibacter sp.]
MNKIEEKTNTEKSLNFIEHIIENDLKTGKNDKRVHTRFPPEPNGYLHIGHAKSICLNFGLAQKYNGKCNLRFDDTNPITEDTEYVESIEADVRWLGFQWDNKFYASDYFEQIYNNALQLIKIGKAYICDLTPEEISANRGTPTKAGVESPYRNRSVEENMDLFIRMKNGEFKDGERVLRAKIDMASPNMHLRDPILYRIRHAHHHRTGDKWCIYPTYDFAHGYSDSIEGITHSICTLEFEVHRPLYDWLIDQVEIHHPQQIEFARLNLTYTMMSKRKLLELVQNKHVRSWDDPRMPTISGLRRRGYTPAAIRDFAERIGVAKRDGIIDVALLEFSIREDLNKNAQRAMAVLEPLKIILTNFGEEEVREFDAIINPEQENSGTRKVKMSKVVYIEREDFLENPDKNFFRLSPSQPVRLKHASTMIRLEKIVKNSTGEIEELHCQAIPEPEYQAGNNPKIKATIHWVGEKDSIEAEVRLYDRLFNVEDLSTVEDYTTAINPNSLKTLKNCKLESNLKNVKVGNSFQFERKGYFCVDTDSTPENLVFNLTVSLKDSKGK